MPRYRGVLSIDGRFWTGSQEEQLECIEELARHYVVYAPWRDGEGDIIWDTPRSINDPTLSDAELMDTWRSLAIALATEIVPAFRERKTGGRPRRFPEFLRRRHAARLVQIVTALQEKKRKGGGPASRIHAFSTLITYLKAHPHPRWLYGSLSNEKVFAQAWKAIPKQIIATPANYIDDRPVERADFEKIWESLPEKAKGGSLEFEEALQFAEYSRRLFLADLPEVAKVVKYEKIW